jgi:hypothetical protein
VYSWDVKVLGYSSATVNSGDEVTFVGGGNVTIEQNSRTITILGKANIYWDAFADNGNIRVPDESRLNFYGENGVSTRVDTSTRSIIINRPLQVRRRASDVGLADTTILDFWNPEINKPKHYTEQVYFWVEDQDNGERRISAYVSPGDYSWDFKTGTNVIETVTNAELVTFAGGANVTVTNVGNVITIAAAAAAGTLQLQQEGTNVGPNDTATINWDNDTALKPAGYTSRVWTEVVNDGAGVRRLVTWYEPGAGGSYYWNLQAGGGAITQIDSTETVNFVAAGDLTVARAGNTITYTYNQPAAYSWIASDNTNTATVTTAETVKWVGDSGVAIALNPATQTFTVDRPLQIEDDGTAVGDDATLAINFDSNGGTGASYAEFEVADVGGGERRVRVKYNAGAGQYFWNLQAGGGAIEQIDSNETVNFAAAGNLTVARVGNTITYTYNQPAAYSWNLQAGSGPTEQITSTETVTFVGQSGIRVTRNNSTIIIEADPTDPPNWGDASRRILTGEIVFSQSAADYLGSLPAYRYGTRQYVDIVHNWNLSNLNNFQLELVDRALDDVGVNVQYYRSGLGAVSGAPDLGPQRFRNLPHWAAQDGNTIRVWATMSRLKPTQMRFRYTLVEL